MTKYIYSADIMAMRCIYGSKHFILVYFGHVGYFFSFLVFFFILLMNNGNYGVINERKCMEIEKRDTGIQGVCPKRIFKENDAQTIKNI